jgi:hypothetical protein
MTDDFDDDSELALVVSEALDQAELVDARQILVAADPGTGEVVLRGSVASEEEADAASLVAERYAETVINELVVDPTLREGVGDPLDVERVVPAEDEVLVGDPDMLAGPDAAITDDINQALEDNEPWEPPDEPLLAPTAAEQRGVLSDPRNPAFGDDADPVDVGELDADGLPAAADLSYQDIEEAAKGHPLPSLSPDVAGRAEPDPEPGGVDELGRTPPNVDVSPFPDPLPGTEPGPGAVGEGTAGGGPLSGVPATETGAAGADTASADPSRGASGGTMSDLGTDRGPESPDDPPLREDFPDRD